MEFPGLMLPLLLQELSQLLVPSESQVPAQYEDIYEPSAHLLVARLPVNSLWLSQESHPNRKEVI